MTTYFNTKDGVILSQTDGTNTWYFQYDTNGSPLGFVLNGTQYFYITNQMGDVLAITDTEGSVVGNYEYDAWGKVLTADTDIANQNPIRYRGYYYDNETGYYYLQSRYYDSNICRFLNTDLYDMARQESNYANFMNLYLYCENNSVNKSDFNGCGQNIYVFYYYNKSSSNNLYEHAKHSVYYNYYQRNVYAYAIDNINTFAKRWNAMKNPYKVYLFLHGTKGSLYFYKTSATAKKIYKMCNFVNVLKCVYLFSCKGGAGNNKVKIANVFAKLSGTYVYALPVGVSYGYCGATLERYAKVEMKYYYLKLPYTYWHKYSAVYKKGKWYYYSTNLKVKDILY